MQAVTSSWGSAPKIIVIKQHTQAIVSKIGAFLCNIQTVIYSIFQFWTQFWWLKVVNIFVFDGNKISAIYWLHWCWWLMLETEWRWTTLRYWSPIIGGPLTISVTSNRYIFKFKHQHSKDSINIEIQSSTSTNRYQFQFTNIYVTQSRLLTVLV